MNRQLYATGQAVSVALNSLSGPSTTDKFRIVRRYRIENRAPMYHIRSAVDDCQRMVPENELSPVMPNVFDRVNRPSNVSQLFPKVVRFGRGATP
jgi:hypothetical protein